MFIFWQNEGLQNSPHFLIQHTVSVSCIYKLFASGLRTLNFTMTNTLMTIDFSIRVTQTLVMIDIGDCEDRNIQLYW